MLLKNIKVVGELQAADSPDSSADGLQFGGED